MSPPKALYMGRRNFLLGLLATTGAVAGWKKLPRAAAGPATGSVPVKLNGVVKWPVQHHRESDARSDDVTTYNNYYEFGTDKGDPAKNAKNFQTSPWTVSVEGEVDKPRKFTMDEIMKLAPLEERIYRHRCVEGMVDRGAVDRLFAQHDPKLVQPTSKAKYVAFTELLRSEADAAWTASGNPTALRGRLAAG